MTANDFDSGDAPAEKTGRRPPKRGGQRSPLALLGGGLVLALLLALTALTFASRSLVVLTEPAEARVTVSGFAVALADRWLVLRGEHELTVAASGYRSHEEAVVIDSGASHTVTVVLEPLPGRLELTTAPPADAQLFLDGEPLGQAPLTLDEVPVGDHLLKATAPLHRAVELPVAVRGRGETQTFTLTLTPAWAPVTLMLAEGEAPAALKVDGEDAGQLGPAPTVLELGAGPHALTVSRPGARVFERTIEVAANEPLALPPIRLAPARIEVTVRSKPAGANILLDGRFLGPAPVTVALDPGSTVELAAFKAGHAERKQRIAVTEELRELTLDLAARTGTLTVTLAPASARLTVDGRPLAAGRHTVTVGTHTLAASAPGYADGSARIEVLEGQDAAVTLRLKPLAEARAERAAAADAEAQAQAAATPTRITAAGHDFVLVRPRAFTMGASRRDPGRRANERLHEVKLQRPYYLGTHEVTNAQFERFRPGHRAGEVSGHALDGADQPVVDVAWDDAAAYANWLSTQAGLPAVYRMEAGKVVGFDATAKGFRLPTEAEWAFAARLRPDGSVRRFPWGEAMPPTLGAGNYADSAARDLVATVVRGYVDNYPVTAPVGSFNQDERGIHDLGGNAAEWTHDVYALEGTPDGAVDPMGEQSGRSHVARGSSWRSGTLTDLRLTRRADAAGPRDDIGFRLARSAP